MNRLSVKKGGEWAAIRTSFRKPNALQAKQRVGFSEEYDVQRVSILT